MAHHRKEKIEKAILRIIAESLLREIKDPRIGFVTVTKVELNKDKSVANVKVSVLGDNKEKRNAMAGLASASGFIQYHVGKNIRLKKTPKIRFHLDDTIEQGTEMVNLLDELVNKQSDDTPH